MKIEKAIEIKTRTGEELFNTDPVDIEEANRLSIEAMKRVEASRVQRLADFIELLPGEDKE